MIWKKQQQQQQQKELIDFWWEGGSQIHKSLDKNNLNNNQQQDDSGENICSICYMLIVMWEGDITKWYSQNLSEYQQEMNKGCEIYTVIIPTEMYWWG